MIRYPEKEDCTMGTDNWSWSGSLRRRAFLASAGAAAAVGAQDSKPEQDLNSTKHGYSNGRHWNATARNVQLGMVMGIIEMSFWSRFSLFELELGWMKIGPEAFDIFDFFGSRKVTNGEACDGVTVFFADPANVSIAIIDALLIFFLRAIGTSASEVEKRVSALRKAES